MAADVHCNPDTQASGEAVDNCWLYAEHQTQANDISLFRITPSTESIKRVATKAESGNKIKSGALELILGEFDQKEQVQNFELRDGKTKTSQGFDFGFKNW